MIKNTFLKLALAIGLLAQAAGGHGAWAATAADLADCAKRVAEEAARLELLSESEVRDSNSLSIPSRRLKLVTSGSPTDTDGSMDPRENFIDTADPSAPFFLTLPNGKRVVRIYLSGLRYLEGSTLDEILRGGIQKVRRIRGFYADGTELTGLYHEDSFPWDPELHVRDDGSWIGHGGLMPQLTPGEIPKVRDANPGRTRMWANIQLVEIAPGVYEERWYFQSSIFSHLPTHDRWITENHFHNYGATFFRNPDGSYVRDPAGNYFMIYERVTEERDGKPWNTEVFAIKVDSTMTRTVGDPIRVIGTYSEKLKKNYQASERGGGREGFLLEGGRPVAIMKDGKKRWLISVSGGDYVSSRYGIHLAISATDDPLSEYTPVTDSEGELIDFADSLRCVLNATWGPGRAAPFYDEHGRLWLAVHLISKDQIPEGEVSDGWPASAEEFVRRHRRVAFVPMNLSFPGGTPRLELDTQDANATFKSALKICVDGGR